MADDKLNTGPEKSEGISPPEQSGPETRPAAEHTEESPPQPAPGEVVVDFDKINVGCTVKVFDITFDEEMEFKIVGSTEANSLEGKISNESPVGQALIGKSVGDVVEVETQAGVMEYKVLDISRSQ